MNLQKKVHWFHRVDQEFYYLLLFNLTVAIYDYQMYTSNWLLFQLIFLTVIVLILFRKQSRIMYKIEFDDINQILSIYYFHFVGYENSVSIPYKSLEYKYISKNYGIVNRMKALVFYSSNKFIAEIPKKNRAGWNKDEISEIMNKLNILDSERNLCVRNMK